MMRFALFACLITLLLSGCLPSASPNGPQASPPPTGLPAGGSPADYPDLGLAPELSGDVWMNSAIPLRLADLRGKVTLIDMWTFG